MKKIVIVILTLFLVACSNNDSNEISSKKKENVELNHEEIMKGDFSSIAGEYINYKGHVITIGSDGLQENERQTGEITFNNNIYTMSIHPKNRDDGGYLLMIFPKGVEVPNLEGLTDIEIIRICHGQADPMSTDEIYIKK